MHNRCFTHQTITQSLNDTETVSLNQAIYTCNVYGKLFFESWYPNSIDICHISISSDCWWYMTYVREVIAVVFRQSVFLLFVVIVLSWTYHPLNYIGFSCQAESYMSALWDAYEAKWIWYTFHLHDASFIIFVICNRPSFIHVHPKFWGFN